MRRIAAMVPTKLTCHVRPLEKRIAIREPSAKERPKSDSQGKLVITPWTSKTFALPTQRRPSTST